VLPRPPGIISVLIPDVASHVDAVGAEGLNNVLQKAEYEVRLIHESDRRQPFLFSGGPDAREVHVRGQILMTRLPQPRRRPGRLLGTLTAMARKGRQRAGGV
jgi:hypothetical protein